MSHKLIEVGDAESGDPLTIDLEKLITTKMLVQACSGGGKSWLLRRIIEQCWGRVHIIVIDPEGEFVTLREKFDIAIAGAEADIPLSPASAAKLAEVVMKNHVNIVCDISEMHPNDRSLWAKNFFEALLRIPKAEYHDTMIVIDESHLLAPESGHGSSVALDAFKDLMARGRKRGLCPVLATQRLGKLSKSVASEAQNLIIGGTTIDVDRERASEAFGVSKAGKPAFFQHLRHFDPGEFFAMGPALPTRDPYRFKSGGVMTSHARFVGGFKQLSARKTAAAFSILLKELKEVPTEAKEEAETLQSLRAEVAKLKAGALDPAVAQKFTIQIQTLGAEKASLQQQLVQTRGELDDLKSAVQRGLSLVGDLGRVFEMNLGVSRQAVAPAPTRTPVTVPPKVRHRSKRPRL